MRVATWNVNDVGKRLPLLLAWLETTQPDIVALQELKSTERSFPRAAIEAAGYSVAAVGEPRWNGVALLARGRPVIEVRRALPGDPQDRQARYLEAAIGGIVVASIYLPNGNPYPGPKYAYKLAWFDRLIAHAAGLLASGHPVLLAGDYNVVPTDADIAATRSWRDNALLQAEARAAYRRLLAQGWTDALRDKPPVGSPWTFWDHRRQRWERDAGMRIDHLLLDPGLALRLKSTGVDRAVRALPDTSDHAPVWVELDAPLG